jgi:prepilin-type N-terminal cleavage/methylation domain-containing protein
MLSSHSSFSSYHSEKSKGFTLIELLVVIAIIAILSVVVILTLNPAELLRQSRDSNRLSDMATMNSALGIYAEDIGGSMGTPSTTYISIFDPTATTTLGDQCQGLILPAQSTSSGWTYQCGASSSYRNVNGSGWIPLNFTTIASGAPIGSLPQDPINQTSSNLFYTYTTDGKTFEVTSVMESSKYRSQLNANPPVGLYPGIEAAGTNLALSGLWNPTGLVGYWNFEEGSGSSTIDQSGNGNTGSWSGTPAGNNSTYYTGGKVGSYAGDFNGSNDYVTASGSSMNNWGPTGQSVSVWFKMNAAMGQFTRLIEKATNTEWAIFVTAGTNSLTVQTVSGGNILFVTPSGYYDGNWHFLVMTYSSGAVVTLYIDGLKTNQAISTIPSTQTGILNIGRFGGGGYNWNGLIDDVRIYNRALSAAEVQALYNAQK